MNKFETKSANAKSEKDLQREAVADLAGRLNKNEIPHSLGDLQELAAGVEAEWREDGYGKAAAFVGQEGDLVMLARKQQEQNGQTPDTQADQVRFLIDDEVIDVSLPPEVQPQGVGVRDGMVDVYDASLADEYNLPEDMKHLVAKFGERLSIATSSPQREVASLAGGYYDLRGVAKETERQQDERRQAETEAHDIENEARKVASSVKRKLFMTARKHAALQEAAYKNSVRTATASKTDKGPGLSRAEWDTLHAYMGKK